jgi:hypothetical protein
MLHFSRAWPLLAVALVAAPAVSQAHDFPTVDRVLYVQECLRNHPGPNYEMVNKCACALDKLATELPYDDYVTMSTAANATTIGGERGSYIRDAEGLQVLIRKYKALQIQVKKACFILPP